MIAVNRNDPRYGFFHPFYKSKKGQILVLATKSDHVRDGLALSHLIRHFPLPEYEGIRMEPGRPGLQLAENLILVGSSPLFVKPDAHPISGTDLPACVGARLDERLRRAHDESCFRFEGGSHRVLVNTVTGERHEPSRGRGDWVDYGVIRRVFRGPLENTIILEGGHRPGTLGTVKVATSGIALDAIADAVRKLPDFDESLPLEILVRARVEEGRELGVYGLDGVEAVPLCAVYNRQWVYDLVDPGQWADQLPWDVHLWTKGEEPVRAVKRGLPLDSVPRVEVQVDLRRADGELNELCRRQLANGPPANGNGDAGAADEMIRRLTADEEAVRLVIVDRHPFLRNERVVDVPPGGTPIRSVRKQFLVHLALDRFLDRSFPCTAESVRTFFPAFGADLPAESLPGAFIGRVNGRIRESLKPLFGTREKPKGYFRIEHSRAERAYRLRLEKSALVLKVRF